MKLGLRIEVSTLRGTREGVPQLVTLLKEHHARGTFLFSLGRDRTGRVIGSLPRVPKLKCYGPVTLMAGTLAPAPDIGSRCAAIMRSVQEDGHEAGIQADDRAGWLLGIGRANERWTADTMRRARDRYEEIFGAPALTHGAPGWRMNRYAYRYTQRLGFRHCSDTRGTGPFIPVVQGEIVSCPQLPTTLPTLDELLAGGLNPDEAVRRLTELARSAPPAGHVYTLRAEVEGGVFAPVLRALLAAWRELGHEPVSLREYAAELDLSRLPRRVVVEQPLPGRAGAASAEGREFLVP